MHWTVALFLSYLCGSVPTAYLAGRLLKGIDLRTIGSGNLGATNVYRSLGTIPAVLVLTIDALKGFIPVALLPSQLSGVYFFDPPQMVWWGLACGVAAIIGHLKPIFLLWKGGGKGVATAAGVFGALAPFSVFIAAVVFFTVVVVTGVVSMASLAAAVVLPIAIGVMHDMSSPIFIISVVISTFVFWSHSANIARLRAGVEPRTFVWKRAAASEEEPTAEPAPAFEIRRVSDHGMDALPDDREDA